MGSSAEVGRCLFPRVQTETFMKSGNAKGAIDEWKRAPNSSPSPCMNQQTYHILCIFDEYPMMVAKFLSASMFFFQSKALKNQEEITRLEIAPWQKTFAVSMIGWEGQFSLIFMFQKHSKVNLTHKPQGLFGSKSRLVSLNCLLYIMFCFHL